MERLLVPMPAPSGHLVEREQQLAGLQGGGVAPGYAFDRKRRTVPNHYIIARYPDDLVHQPVFWKAAAQHRAYVPPNQHSDVSSPDRRQYSEHSWRDGEGPRVCVQSEVSRYVQGVSGSLQGKTL